MDPGFGLMYFLLIEVLGQWLHNGIFLGIPTIKPNSPSIAKRIGFPLDIVVNVVHCSFATMVMERSWVPSVSHCAVAALITLYAQLKDYEEEKKANIKTTATVLGVPATNVLIALTALCLSYTDLRFLPSSVYMLAKLAFPENVKRPKATFVLVLNYIYVLFSHLYRIFLSPSEILETPAETIADVYPQDNIFVLAAPKTETRLLKIYGVLFAASIVIRVVLCFVNSSPQSKEKTN